MTDPSKQPDESSTRPYLLRAIYQWAIDHQMTPQVLVDAGVAGVVVPAGCVKDGRVVLTIHPQSVQNLEMGNEHLRFSARFAGAPFAVCLPVAAVSAIFCRENGRGIVFQEQGRGQGKGQGSSVPPAADDGNRAAHAGLAQKPAPATAAPHLKLVK